MDKNYKDVCFAKQDCLSSEQREFYEQEGYLVLPHILNERFCEDLKEAVDAVHSHSHTPMNEADLLGRNDVFLNLIDLPVVLAKICELLGWNIWVNHTHLNIYPPEKKDSSVPLYFGWHRDGGALNGPLGSSSALIFIKVAFYLTDLREPDSGQTYVLPGSHRNSTLDVLSTDPLSKDARPLNVSAGTAVIYHPQLVHSIHSPNYSDCTRRTVFVQWAYRWLFPVDPMRVEHLRESVNNPVRRQLLGFSSQEGNRRKSPDLPYAGQNRSGRYYPFELEVPLRKVMEEQWGLSVNGRVWSNIQK